MEANLISAIIRTLETIPVYGKVNCNKMAGCISALESLLMPPAEPAKEDNQVSEEEKNG